MPTLTPRDWREEDPPPTNGQVLVIFGIPVVVAGLVLFVKLLWVLGEL